MVADEPSRPVSARKHTHRVPRRLLLDEDRLAMVSSSGRGFEQTVRHADQDWQVLLRPLLSPVSKTVMAIQAGVWPVGEQVSPPPLVGCWEWRIRRDAEGRPTLDRRSYWDENVFRIYRVDQRSSTNEEGYFDVSDWGQEMVDPADQIRVNGSIRDALQASGSGDLASICGRLYGLTFDIVTGYGSSDRGAAHLRSIGFLAPFTPEDESLSILGLSHEAPWDFHEMALDQDHDAVRVDDVLRGVMELAHEPMAVVDPESLDVLMASPAWRRQDFGHVGALTELVGDDDGLHELIATAADDRNMAARSLKIVLEGSGVRRREVTMTVTGVQAAVGRDVVVRLDLL